MNENDEGIESEVGIIMCVGRSVCWHTHDDGVGHMSSCEHARTHTGGHTRRAGCPQSNDVSVWY